MHKFILSVISCFIFLITTNSAQAGWVEAKSENFIFIGDTSEKKAEVIVQELEEYRDIIFRLFNWGTRSELIPVHVYAVRSDKDIKNITGNAWAAGVYTTSHEGPVFIANIKGGFGRKSAARNTAYHEYTHHLMSMYNSIIFPQWYNEGMAEYLSTFEVSNKGVVKVGLPSNGRGYALANGKWFDTNIIVNSVKRYPFRNSSSGRNPAISKFYAQSWLATHFIQSEEGYAEKLKTYLLHINTHGNTENAFEDAFGLTPDAFEERLKAYYKRNKYPGLKITMGENYTPKPVTTRKLSKGEAQYHLGEAVRKYRRNEKGLELAGNYYEEAALKKGPIADITASQSLIELKKGNLEKANQLAEEAVSLSPDDSRILQIAGHVALHSYKDTGSQESKEQISHARSILKKAMRKRPDNIQAHYDYVTSYTIRKDPPSKQAIFSAEECAFYYRGRNFVDSNLPVAEVLIKAEKHDLAKMILKQTRVWSNNPYNRKWADSQIEMMP